MSNKYPDLRGTTWVTPEQFAALDRVTPAGGSFLEVGTAAGITAAMIARGGREVVCIDNFIDTEHPDVIRDDGDRWAAWKANNPGGRVHLWRGDLGSFRRFCFLGRFDVAFIDADHRSPAVDADLANVRHLVKPGGIICAHDYGDPDWVDVKGAVDAFCEQYQWKIRETVGSLAIMTDTHGEEVKKGGRSFASQIHANIIDCGFGGSKGVKGLTVSCGYDDFLAVTLPRNARHLTDILVVTAPGDERTQAVVATVPSARCFVTDAFYRDGAKFNKGAAIEQAFDVLGRDGWTLIWDADVLLPDSPDWRECDPSRLYGAKRRLLNDARQWHPSFRDWKSLPLSPEYGWPGYFQLFHGSSPRIRDKRPWYATHSPHAAISDKYFHDHWPVAEKGWLPFEVLHLGPRDVNWHGRASPRLDGDPVPLTLDEVEQYYREAKWPWKRPQDSFWTEQTSANR